MSSVIFSQQGRQGFLSQTFTSFVTTNASSRRAITEFSKKSSARMRRYLRCCRADYEYFGTLTYPAEYESDGKAVKTHLARFIKRLRRMQSRSCKTRVDERDSFSIFWFLEFQKRGAPHFHYFLSAKLLHESETAIPIRGMRSIAECSEINMARMRAKIALAWFECVDSKDPKHLAAGTQFDLLRQGRAGTIKYATKYALKAEQKKVPENYESVGRFWGVSGDRFELSATLVLNLHHSTAQQAHTEARRLVKLLKQLAIEGEVAIHRSKFTGKIRGWYCNGDFARRRIERAMMLAASCVHSTYGFETQRVSDWYDNLDIYDIENELDLIQG